jgi:hypothetical protein
MPRNSNGQYQLPLDPVESGEIIQSAWANTTTDDLAVALSNSLDTLGTNGMKAPFRLYDGSVSAPGLSFILEPSTGFYRKANGVMGFAVGGVEIMEIASNYVAGLEPATPSSFTTKNYVDQNLALLNANTDAGGQILQDQINATNTAVANLQSQLDTANANITAQGNAIAALQTRCSNLEARMTAAEGRLGTHDSQITDLYNTKASLNANVRFNSVVANQDIVAYS